MTTWLFRGLVFAALWTIERFVQGTLVNLPGTKSGLISIGLAALMTIPAFLWGLLDGRADAKASPDPDYRHDLAMRWLMAGLVAGALSGIVCYIISKLTVNMYAGNIFTEITTIASFTALMVFLPAIIACSVGRWLVDRVTPYEGRRRLEGYDSDVFERVQRDDDFIDAQREARIAPAVEAADYPETFTHRSNPTQVQLAEREQADAVTEKITDQIREQAARIEDKIDDITGGGKKP